MTRDIDDAGSRFTTTRSVGELHMADPAARIGEHLVEVVAVDGEVIQIGEHADVADPVIALDPLGNGNRVGGVHQGIAVNPAERFDEDVGTDRRRRLRGERQIRGGDVVLLDGGHGVQTRAVEGVESDRTEACSDADRDVDAVPEFGGSRGSRQDAALVRGQVAAREVQMGQTDAGVVDGGDEAFDVTVGGDRLGEGPPELDGAESGVTGGMRPAELRQAREQDGAVDRESSGVHRRSSSVRCSGGSIVPCQCAMTNCAVARVIPT